MNVHLYKCIVMPVKLFTKDFKFTDRYVTETLSEFCKQTKLTRHDTLLHNLYYCLYAYHASYLHGFSANKSYVFVNFFKQIY